LQLEAVLLGLQADPDNSALLELKVELENIISLTEAEIADLKPAVVPATIPQKKAVEPPVKEKWSRENHPAFKKTVPAPVEETEATTNFKVNDMVLAKWHSGDKGFYPARITSITGSSTAPVYIVKFKSYETTETLRAKDIKPIVNPNKRKADGTPVAPSIPTPPINANIISAAADINPELAHQTKREPSKVSDGPVRPAKVPKKIKANKELEAGKSKWQDFAAKGKFGKAAKKDSMFRTPEGVNGRGKISRSRLQITDSDILSIVGFTGSGQTMRKDQARSKHIYQTNGEDEGF
jgi:survival-of-motor-neuron-related-splicing factor 30